MFGWKSLNLMQLLHEGERRATTLNGDRNLSPESDSFLKQLNAVCHTAGSVLEDPTAYKNPWQSIVPGQSQQEDLMAEPQFFFSEDGTLAFLRSRDIPYIAVDVPQGHKTSMPSTFEVTSSQLAVVRFHGRNHETWDIKGAPPNLRFRHDYEVEELAEWVPRIKEMERSAKQVHALMNNNYSNYSVKNAQQLEKLLEAWQK